MGAGAKITIGGIAVAAFMIGSILMGASAPGAACGGGAVDATQAAALPDVAGFSGDQLVNAAAIMNAAAAMGLDERAQTIGVMTAIGESSLRNITYGDWETSGVTNPDGSRTTSIGLFQQQASWGTTAERLDPTTSATLFFQRMVNVQGWENMDPSAVAHKVQINANPNHYTKYWDSAVAVVSALRGSGGGCGQTVYPLDQGYTMTSDYGPRNTSIAGASSWHPAIDLVGRCGDPIYAVQEGTVTRSDRLWLTITHPDGYEISYLHTHKWERLVNEGDQVAPGQQIAAVGNEKPSSGCHLDIRIYTPGTTNPDVAALPTADTLGGPSGFVSPERFFDLFGLPICPPDWCTRTY